MSRLEINFKFFNKFNVDLNAFGFENIINSVYENCELFVSDELFIEIEGQREDREIDENQFHERIENIFLLILKV